MPDLKDRNDLDSSSDDLDSRSQDYFDKEFENITGPLQNSNSEAPQSQAPNSQSSGLTNPLDVLDAKNMIDSVGKKKSSNSLGKDLDPSALDPENSLLKSKSANGFEAGGGLADSLVGKGGGAGAKGAVAKQALGKEAALLTKDPRVKAALIAWKHKKKILVTMFLIPLILIFIGLAGILQGPLQFLHMAALLEQRFLPFVEDQVTARLTQVYHYLDNPDLPKERRMGAMADSLASKLEENETQEGVALHYDGPDQQLSAITIDATNDRAVRDFGKVYGPLGDPVDGQYRVDNLYDDGMRARKALRAYSAATNLDVEKVSALERRRLKTKAEISYKWLDNIEANTQEELEEAYIADRDEKITQGKTNGSTLTAVGAEEGESIDQTEVSTLSEEEARQQTIDAGKSGLFGGLCRAADVAEDLDKQTDLVWGPSMRVSSKMLSLGSQIKSNFNVRNDELALESQYFNTDEMVYEGAVPANESGNLTKGKVNWTASALLRDQLGETGGVPVDQDLIPRMLTEDNAVILLISSIPGIEQVCNITNGAGIVFDVFDSIASSILVNVMPRSVMEPIIDVAARGNIGNPVKYYSKGPNLFAEASTGTLIGVNEEAWSSGGLPCSADAEEIINRRVAAEEKAQYAQNPFLTRLFDYKDSRSLLAQLFIRTDYSSSPTRYSERALAAITPDRLGRTLSYPAYAQEASATSVQEKFFGMQRICWTEEELAHALEKEGVNNNPKNYEAFIFQDEFEYYRKYTGLFTELCYGMEVNSNGSVTPVANSNKHPESEDRKQYCKGTAEKVNTAIRDAISALEAQLAQIAEDNGWSDEEIDANRNSEGVTICNINSQTREICARIGVLKSILLEMRTGPSSSGCRGVFYLPYSHGLHNARADFDEPDNFPERNDCYTFPGEKLHQNARIYLSLMGALQSTSCLSGSDTGACSDTGIQAKSNQSGQPGGGATLGEVECPVNMVGPNSNGYYQLPEAPNGEYRFWPNTPPNERWGSQELVCTLYTVALRYKEIYKDDSTLIVRDLNASSHLSHKWGVGVDVHAEGNIWAANHVNDGGKYSTEATETLGKLFADSTYLRNVWWCEPSDGSLNAIKEYAADKGDGFNAIKCLPNHSDHFHIDLDTQYRLPVQFNF